MDVRKEEIIILILPKHFLKIPLSSPPVVQSIAIINSTLVILVEFPRVLDAGQCNDSYSLTVIALKLKEIFGLDDINDLPIIYNIAWYEQKAVTVLLALLYLGVKNIHLGPTLPAFLSPNVTKVLVEKFNIGGITNVEDDIKNMIG